MLLISILFHVDFLSVMLIICYRGLNLIDMDNAWDLNSGHHQKRSAYNIIFIRQHVEESDPILSKVNS